MAEPYKFYIYHESYTEEDGTAYFGPFSDDEIVERCNDAYADLLAGVGELDSIELTDEAAAAIGYINPREYWMEQLEECEES